MPGRTTKVAVLVESDYYEPEISYYQRRFPEDGIEVDFVSRLWGQPELTFHGHEYQVPFRCGIDLDDVDAADYQAVIVPSGMVADRLRYSEDVHREPPALRFLRRAFAEAGVVKGIICHGMWLLAAAPELVRGRNAVVHNNLFGDLRNMGGNYVDQDVVVDGDLVTARTGEHCNVFARRIIEMLANQR
ncbi:DJ-1/PfpI family protein [Saccharopolyspora sp. NPDC003752]